MIAVFDVGATHTRIGLSRDGRELAERRLVDTPPHREGWTELLAMAQRLAGNEQITAAAAGLPGIVSAVGEFTRPMNLTGWNGINALEPLRKLAAGGPATIENDVAVIGLGEAQRGAGRATGIMAYVTVSTGVNGVRLVDGKIDRKAQGFEIGRQIIELSEPTGKRSRRATLEELIGGRSLQDRYGRLPSKIDDPTVWTTEIDYLAIGLYNLILTWSPDLIVLGGSMMRDLPLDRIEAALKEFPVVFKALPELRAATLGEWGGLYGGLELLRQQS